MPQFLLEDTSIDELFDLKKEIDSFLNAQDAAERALCEGNGEAEYIKSLAHTEALKLKKRIRGLAIEWGIHQEFLAEYEAARSQSIGEVALKELERLAA